MKWNDVTKKLPERNTEVMVWIDGHRGPAWSNNHAKIAYLAENGKWYTVGTGWTMRNADDEVVGVIHWATFTKPKA